MVCGFVEARNEENDQTNHEYPVRVAHGGWRECSCIV